MRPTDIFDICLERVRECQAMQARVLAIRADASTHGGPPKVGDVVSEYIADFALAGKRALRMWPARIPFFLEHFVEGKRAVDVMKSCNLKEQRFYKWVTHTKFVVGRELERSELYPPSQYRRRTVRDDDETQG